MKRVLRDTLFFALSINLLDPAAFPKTDSAKCPKDTRLSADVPISLGVGTIRTPEFRVKSKPYDIDIRVQWNMPTDELQCKMGFQLSPGYPVCHAEPLIETEWRVWDGEKIVARGIDKGKSEAFEAGACYFARTLGQFTGKANRKYVVEVKVTKDGTPLNATNPHLVVTIVTGNAF
jgi:hypothetical protein